MRGRATSAPQVPLQGGGYRGRIPYLGRLRSNDIASTNFVQPPHGSGGRHHLRQGRANVVPIPGFETAIWIDPNLRRRKHSYRLLEEHFHFTPSWNAGRVNIVDAGPNRARIPEDTEDIEKLHVAARCLDRNYVDVEIGDRRKNVVELRIAHMSMDLRLGCRPGGREAKGHDRPCQVIRSGRFPQRQALSQSGLVNLDDADSCCFEIGDLVSYRQSELARGNVSLLIVPYE